MTRYDKLANFVEKEFCVTRFQIRDKILVKTDKGWEYEK